MGAAAEGGRGADHVHLGVLLGELSVQDGRRVFQDAKVGFHCWSEGGERGDEVDGALKEMFEVRLGDDPTVSGRRTGG